MPLTPGLNLPFGIQPVNPVPVDSFYGPYVNVAQAVASIPLALRYDGMTVQITGSGNYWWLAADLSDTGLIPKNTGGGYEPDYITIGLNTAGELISLVTPGPTIVPDNLTIILNTAGELVVANPYPGPQGLTSVLTIDNSTTGYDIVLTSTDQIISSTLTAALTLDDGFYGSSLSADGPAFETAWHYNTGLYNSIYEYDIKNHAEMSAVDVNASNRARTIQYTSKGSIDAWTALDYINIESRASISIVKYDWTLDTWQGGLIYSAGGGTGSGWELFTTETYQKGLNIVNDMAFYIDGGNISDINAAVDKVLVTKEWVLAQGGGGYQPDNITIGLNTAGELEVIAAANDCCIGIPITYASLLALYNAGTMQEGAMYLVTDAVAGIAASGYSLIPDGGLYVKALSSSVLSIPATGIFLNPDYSAGGIAGNYTGVAGFTGVPYTTNVGIWYLPNEGGYVDGDVVIWNQHHFQVTDISLTNGLPPYDYVFLTSNPAYTLLPKTVANVGYIRVSNLVHYDILGDGFSDLITYREDYNQNKIGYSGIWGFQWGNPSVANCTGDGVYNIQNSRAQQFTEVNLNSGTSLLVTNECLGSIYYTTILTGGEHKIDIAADETFTGLVATHVSVVWDLKQDRSYEDVTLTDDHSNIIENFDVTGITFFDIPSYQFNHVGEAHVTSTNPTETFTDIDHWQTFPLVIRPKGGLILTIENGPNVKLFGGVDVVLNSLNEDWIEFRYDGDTDILYQISGSTISSSGYEPDNVTIGLNSANELEVIAIPGATTADNGLTMTLDNIQLGGNLVQHTSINGVTEIYNFSVVDVNYLTLSSSEAMFQTASGRLTMDSVLQCELNSLGNDLRLTTDPLFSGGNGNIFINTDAGAITLEWSDGYSLSNSLVLSQFGNIFTDNIEEKGISYAADYSLANSIPNNPRWIPDKEYVDTVAANAVVQIISPDDKFMVSLVTTSDGDLATNNTITNTPVDGCYVEVKYNGVEYEVGNGVITKAFYFSGDSGASARGFSSSHPNGQVQAGDELYFNGSVAGFQLETSFRISLLYLISN